MKKVLLAMVFAFTTMTLVGCGGGGASTPAKTPAKDDTKKDDKGGKS